MSVPSPIAAILLANCQASPSTPPPEMPVLGADPSPSIQEVQKAPTPTTPAMATEPPPSQPSAEPLVQMEQTAPIPSADNDITVTARRASPGDPLERVNIKSFEAVQAVDKAVIGPVALTFERVVPTPIRLGLRNALSNLQEPAIFLNFLVQLKPGKGAETLGRFAINSTLGIAGLFDIAKRRPFKLPYRPNGFGDSLGYYGVKPGPYLYLPVIGATTLRDLFGTVADQMVFPTVVGRPFNQLKYSAPRFVVRELDQRAGFEEELRTMRESGDFYGARRDFYLRTRQAEIDGLHAMGSVPAKGEMTPKRRRQLEIEALRGKASETPQQTPPECAATPPSASAVPAAAAPIAPPTDGKQPDPRSWDSTRGRP